MLCYLTLSNKNIMVNEYVLGNKGGWEVINSVVTLRQALVLTLNPKFRPRSFPSSRREDWAPTIS